MRILIADDHAIVRKGLIQLILEDMPSAEIVEVSDAEDLIKAVHKQDWDLVICDLTMPGRSGLDALKQIKQSKPRLPVLIISMHPQDQYAVRVLKAGASGYLGKDLVHEELMQAIRMVMQGRKYITPAVAEKLAEVFNQDASREKHELLSDREFDVFKHLAAGKSISEIASQLSLSVTTVSTYRSRILEKMGFRSNADITRYAIEHKLL
jgi:two-component system invasion response regulator UvrY